MFVVRSQKHIDFVQISGHHFLLSSRCSSCYLHIVLRVFKLLCVALLLPGTQGVIDRHPSSEHCGGTLQSASFPGADSVPFRDWISQRLWRPQNRGTGAKYKQIDFEIREEYTYTATLFILDTWVCCNYPAKHCWGFLVHRFRSCRPSWNPWCYEGSKRMSRRTWHPNRRPSLRFVRIVCF